MNSLFSPSINSLIVDPMLVSCDCGKETCEKDKKIERTEDGVLVMYTHPYIINAEEIIKKTKKEKK